MTTPEQGRELRVALYSHDSVGLGHTRRNLAIAQALADRLPALTGRTVSGLLITGERSAPSFRAPRGFDWVVMPGIRKGRDRYEPRTLAVQPGRVLDIRSAVISAALTSFRPHVVIVDRHAFGVDGELTEPLRALRAAKPDTRFVLGLREVLDAPHAVRAEWERVGVDRVSALFDRIWVYGDRAVHDPLATGELPGELAGLVDFTGLLAQGRTTSGRAPAARRPFVVTMVGGGGDGVHLARAAAAARVPEGMQHLVVTGPQMPSADRALVEAAAGRSTRVTARVADGLAYLDRAEAAVTMGGYNTMAEVLTTGTPVLVAPRTDPRTEQLIRVRGLARAGAVDMIDPALVDPEAVERWLEAAVADRTVADRQEAARRSLDLAGLDHVVDLAASLSARPTPPARAVPVAAGAAAPAAAAVPTTAASVPTPGVLHAAI